MISTNIRILIEKLKKKIESNQAIWTITSRDTEFKLELQKGAITVDNWEDNNIGYVADLTVINENGDVIESVAADLLNLPSDYEELRQIHELVKNSYYKVDETFKTIFDELDSDKTIGKDNRFLTS